MPLVVPGLLNTSGSKTASDARTDWENKLVGKTLVSSGPSNEINFAKSELPKDIRVVQDGAVMSMDHKPERVNVHVDGKGMVERVTSG